MVRFYRTPKMYATTAEGGKSLSTTKPKEIVGGLRIQQENSAALKPEERQHPRKSANSVQEDCFDRSSVKSQKQLLPHSLGVLVGRRRAAIDLVKDVQGHRA